MIHLGRGVAGTTADIARGLSAAQAIRAVNYHSTPRCLQTGFRAEIAALARRYGGLDANGLDRMMAGEPLTEPVVVPILFEGFRDHYDVMLPIVEAHGLTAWFVLPPAFLDAPPGEQRPFAKRHALVYPRDEYPGERIALSWAELRDIEARGHLVACHSRTHAALTPETPDDVLEDEIVRAKHDLDAALARPVEMFCYLRGSDHGVNARADARLLAAGYRYLLSNFRLQRLQ